MSNRPWGAANGPREPAPPIPMPRAPALRRTSTVDVSRPNGLRGGSIIVATGKDLLVLPGKRSVVDEAWLELTTDVNHDVTAVRGSHVGGDTGTVLGRSLGRGFRSAAGQRISTGSLARLLVDDAATVGLLGSYVEIYHGRPVNDSFARPNICAGWIDGGVLLTATRRAHDVPLPRGPLAPGPLAGDGASTDAVRPLPVDGLRRARCIDVVRCGDTLAAGAAFRDSFIDRGHHERVIHEYSVTATVDLVTGTIVSAGAVPRVLPWTECPNAVGSVDVLVGSLVRELGCTVGLLRGVGGCTHLSAVLVALAGTFEAVVDNDGLNMYIFRG